MAYTIEAEAVLFEGRRVKGADAATFEDLGGGLGRDRGAVWVGTRRQAADAASFEVLGEGHARDRDAVYHRMATKLKPLKGADPATFESLGEFYGRDRRHVYFEAKRVRLKKGAGTAGSFREIGRPFGTDGAWLYFGAQQLDPPPAGAVDLSRAVYHAFGFCAVNCPNGILSDGERHALRTWPGEWAEVPGIAPERAGPLGADLPGRFADDFVTDGEGLWFRGQELSAARGEDLEVLGPTVVRAGRRAFAGTDEIQLDHLDPVWLADGLYVDPSGVMELPPVVRAPSTPERIAPLAPPPTVADALGALLDRAVPLVAAIADRHLPVEWRVDAAPEGELPPVRFEVRGGPGRAVTIEGEGAAFEADAAGWLGIACRLWASSRDRRDRFCAHFNGSTGYPDTDRLHALVLRRCTAEAMALAAALCAAGERLEGQLLAHMLIDRARVLGVTRGERRTDPVALAALGPEAARGARYGRRRYDIGKTTNLGVVKVMSTSPDLEDPDPRVRREAVETLGMAAFAAARAEKALPLAAGPLIARLEGDPSPMVRECAAVALEMASLNGFVAAEMGRSYPYAALEGIAAALVRFGSNVDVNRVRLIEALCGLGREEEARALEEELLAEVDPGAPCPGPYVNRARFQDFRAAALAARARALPGRGKELPRDELLARADGMRAELEALREEAGGDRPDLDDIASRL